MKWAGDRSERALVVINKDRANSQSFSTQWAGQLFAGVGRFEDLSPDGVLEHTPDFKICTLRPSGFHVLWAV
jgi:hypothetical protein